MTDTKKVDVKSDNYLNGYCTGRTDLFAEKGRDSKRWEALYWAQVEVTRKIFIKMKKVDSILKEYQKKNTVPASALVALRAENESLTRECQGWRLQVNQRGYEMRLDDLRAQLEQAQAESRAQLAELHAISEALGTNEGHSSVDHIKQLQADAARMREALEMTVNQYEVLHKARTDYALSIYPVISADHERLKVRIDEALHNFDIVIDAARAALGDKE